MPPTVKAKVDALRGLLKDDRLVADVLLKAGTSEKELLELGVDFKELDGDDGAEETTTAAQVDAEESDADSKEVDDSAEDTETTKQDKPKADEPKEVAAEEEETQDVYLADVTVDEFADMLAGALDDVFGPYFDKLDEMAFMMQKSQHPPVMPAAKKEASDDTAQEADTAMEQLRAQNEALTQELTTLKEQKEALDEVISNLPKAIKARGFSASESDETVLKEGDPKLKLMPQPDSALAEFTGFVIGNPTQR